MLLASEAVGGRTVQNVKMCDFEYSKDEELGSACKTGCGTPEYVAPQVSALATTRYMLTKRSQAEHVAHAVRALIACMHGARLVPTIHISLPVAGGRVPCKCALPKMNIKCYVHTCYGPIQACSCWHERRS